MEYCYIATEVLCEVLFPVISFSLSSVPFLDCTVKNWCLFLPHLQVLRSMQPLIVYFPDSSQWLSRAVPKSNRKDFLNKVQNVWQIIRSCCFDMWTKQSWNWVKGERKICKLLKLSSYSHPYTYMHIWFHFQLFS